jgi:hypothetical protein
VPMSVVAIKSCCNSQTMRLYYFSDPQCQDSIDEEPGQQFNLGCVNHPQLSWHYASCASSVQTVICAAVPRARSQAAQAAGLAEGGSSTADNSEDAGLAGVVVVVIAGLVGLVGLLAVVTLFLVVTKGLGGAKQFIAVRVFGQSSVPDTLVSAESRAHQREQSKKTEMTSERKLKLDIYSQYSSASMSSLPSVKDIEIDDMDDTTPEQMGAIQAARCGPYSTFSGARCVVLATTV